MDAPAQLKRTVIPGDVWELYAEPLQAGLEACNKCAGILRVGLTGDHLRIITERGLSESQLHKVIQEKGLSILSLTPGEPTLEDVFLSLAKG